MTLVTTLEKIDFLWAGFENRNGRVVPLQCQFERRNLRSHEKKFTGPRGSKKIARNEDTIVELFKLYSIMALKVKAKEQYQNIGKYAGTFRYVMMPELYTALAQDKVIREAALRSGVSRGVMQACWDAAGEVIKAWATEGHSVALPGLGTMRFGLRAKSVENVNDVKAGLISSRRIIFTPTSELKEELAKTAVQITCYDKDGKEIKRVTSSDDGNVEDPEQENGGSTGNGGNGNTGGSTTNPSTGGGNAGGDND